MSWGVCKRALKLQASRKGLLGKSQGENRNREIRPSGIVGGPRETWSWWECDPASQSKERGW